ncbi:sugar transferase [Parasegetibacter sp. NRK P23]|uniref:sugar transferase n=1 Tax=Parasegetibacter sp. NRK P23 TaxID=2942999 RepID=UPI0020449BC8|nr:sugar transferase [Parasegetibacter sp. NRK P23]MCM5527277.1 sugar transferase [Parasegetibacter sp. NRK P23]
MKQLDTLFAQKPSPTYVKRVAVAGPKKKTLEGSYLYIGKDFQYTNSLMEGFSSSYYFENFFSALKVLPRLDDLQTLPELILFDGNQAWQEIEIFLQKIKEISDLAGVPVLAEVKDCSQAQINKLQNHPAVDDLIVVRESAASLRKKVAFLRKMKENEKELMIEDRLETEFPRELNLNYFLKRGFDLTISGSLLLLLSPIFILIAIAIRLESKGNIFYVSPRAGRGYKVFKFYKFRTMVADADRKVTELLHLNQYGVNTGQPVFFKVSNDPRITRIGAFLRNTSIDELPQLINVFLGDMSLVGNRPLPLYEAATLTSNEYAARFLAPAGITGLWQIKKRGDSNMSIQERINLDIDYAARHNFMYDLWIIANTPSALLQKENV